MPKVLVADDSITVRKVAERLLTEAGMEVALAASGEEAMAYLSTEHPDFIISDVIMPDKSGYDVCRFVRSQATLADTPVLLISGIVNDEVSRQAESCRANGVLKKPFQGASLQDRVRDMLAKQIEKEAPIVTSSSATVPSDGDASVPDIAPAPPDDPSVTMSGPKAYRITEEQLQSFRQSSARIKELESLVEEEKARSAQMSEQVEQAAQRHDRIGEMEASLAEYQRKIEELSAHGERLSGVERRNLELESLVAELRTASMAVQAPAAPSENHVTMEALQGLLSDQQQRLAELAREVMMHGESGERFKTIERALAEEQTRTSNLATRCTDLEQELVRANGRVEECTNLLEKISRLAGRPDDERNR
ncbi:MAG TPA: response regulator [Nitrospiraceae bacterium]|nr:response regulator [Nitrospiraceae bacterium]